MQTTLPSSFFFIFFRKKEHPGDSPGAANSSQFHPIFRIELIPYFFFKWIELIFSSDGDQREALLPDQIKTCSTLNTTEVGTKQQSAHQTTAHHDQKKMTHMK